MAGVLAWGEWENWRASHRLVPAPRGGTEAVVVLGFRNHGTRLNLVNRWRVRAGLRSMDNLAPQSRLVMCGGAARDGDPSEAALMAAYARTACGYAADIVLDEASRSTWENVSKMIPLVEDVDRIKIVSNTMHALKARAYLARQRPDLTHKLTRGSDYRLGEWFPLKPLLAAHGRWTLRNVASELRHH